jgi:hypothetical protein
MIMINWYYVRHSRLLLKRTLGQQESQSGHFPPSLLTQIANMVSLSSYFLRGRRDLPLGSAFLLSCRPKLALLFQRSIIPLNCSSSLGKFVNSGQRIYIILAFGMPSTIGSKCDIIIHQFGTPNEMTWRIILLEVTVCLLNQRRLRMIPPRLCARKGSDIADGNDLPIESNLAMRERARSSIVWNDSLIKRLAS